MIALRRHALAWLSAQAWHETRRDFEARGPSAQARSCLQHWVRHELPLVVTRQASSPPGDGIALGLPAPARWGRERLVLRAWPAQGLRWGAFPEARDVGLQLDTRAQPAWTALCDALDASGLVVRVYGSHGWQRLTGLDYLRTESDIDLQMACRSAHDADQAVALLQDRASVLPRLDGELTFEDGAAVAWREWGAWRHGRAARVLVKRLHGAALEVPSSWWACT